MPSKEVSVTLKAETNQFKADMKAVNTELAGTKSEMALVTSEFDKNDKSQAALTARSQVMSKQVDAQKQKVQLLTDQLARETAALGENDARTQKTAKDLNYATAELNKMQRALDENNRELNKHSQSADDAAYHAKMLADNLELLKSAAHGVQGGLKLSGQALTAAGKGLTALYAAGTAATGAVVALGVSGLKTLTQYALESANAKDVWGRPLSTSYWQLGYSLRQLDTASQSAKAALGSVLLPTLKKLSDQGGDMLNRFSKDMTAAEGDTQAMGQVMSKYTLEAAQTLREDLPEMISLGKDLLSGLGEGIETALPELLEIGGEILDELLTAIEEAAPTIGPAALEIVMQLLDFLIMESPELLAAGIDMVTNIITGLAESAPLLIEKGAELVPKLLQILIEKAPELLTAGMELVSQIITGLVDKGPDLLLEAGELIFELVGALVAAAADFLGVGEEAVEQIKEGFSKAWDTLVDFVRGLWDGLKKIFAGGINVPINMGAEGGDAIGFPHKEGLDYVPFNDYPALLHQGEMVLTRSEADAYRRGTGGNVVNVNLYAQTLDDAQVQYLVRVVNDELGREVD